MKNETIYVKQTYNGPTIIFIYEVNDKGWKRISKHVDSIYSSPSDYRDFTDWDGINDFCGCNCSQYSTWQVLTTREAFIDML